MTTAKRRTKGAGSVFKDGRGLWHFRKEITPDPRTGGRRIIEVTGKVKADARTRFEAKIAQYERTGVIRTTKGPTMGGYAERWMQSHRRHVKPTTYSNEIGWVRTMCAHIGGIRVTELKPSDIQTMIDDLLTTRKARTVNAYLSVLNCMLDDAEREDLIQANPMRRIRMPKTRQYERPILDPEDPRKLIDTAKTALAGKDGPDEGEMWSLMFELAFSTGMRPGERYALMPRQLERRRGIPGINVCQQVQRYRGGKNATIPTWLNARHLCGDRWLTTTKTDKGKRFIPITEHLWDKLWNHIAKWGIDNTNSYSPTPTDDQSTAKSNHSDGTPHSTKQDYPTSTCTAPDTGYPQPSPKPAPTTTNEPQSWDTPASPPHPYTPTGAPKHYTTP